MTQRILLVAYQCGPGMGSVSQIGWEWYQRLCTEQPVTLVTHIRNKAALEQANAPVNDSEIIYIDTEWFAGPLYRLARRIFPKSEHSVFLVSSLDYFVFDFSAYRQLAKRLAQHASFDVLHRVTPVTLAAPTWLGRLGLPIIIGPLNSGLKDPRGFNDTMRQESTWLIKVREVTRLLDALLGSTRSATRILTASRTTLNAIAPRYRPRCQMMLENGVELNRFTVTPWPTAPGPKQPLRILFTGRLVPIKGLEMLLNAVAQLKKLGYALHLDVVGDGPMRDNWMALSHSLEIEAYVTFHGAQPFDAVAQYMQACHVFCLPSVRESGGAVLLEAMASARPVIALNFGGPGEIVDNEVGALLPLTNPEQVTADLVASLGDVILNPQTWKYRGEVGRQRVEQHYSWPAKIRMAQNLYQQVVNERRDVCP